MAKKPGAGGVILLAVILGLVTAYFVWGYLRDVKKQSQENWQPVVVATVEIKQRTKITREMITLTRFPQELIAPDATVKIEQVEGKMSLSRIKAKEQIRSSDLVQEGQVPSLAYDVPPGMRAIAIGADEIKAVGSTVKPGDRVDILATYHDPVTRAETTQILLQNVLILAVNKGQTDPAQGEGANSSMTMAVEPKDAEMLMAADRSGALRVAMRAVGDNKIIATSGVTARDFLGSPIFELPSQTSTQEAVKATPVIISPPREAKRPEITVIRGTTPEVVTP